MRYIPLYILLTLASLDVYAQNSNPITTAVPFLSISPDARSGGMGDGGVAISSDANTTFWNPARMVFIKQSTNISLSYSPWLSQIIKNSYLGYAAIVQRLTDKSYAAGFSFRDLTLGNIPLYDQSGTSLGFFSPNEIAIDASVAHKFGEDFSLGLTLRYFNSNLSNSLNVQGIQTKPINSIASDVSFSYNYPYNGGSSVYSFGVDVSNIGPKVSYTANGPTYFLPTNLRMGPSLTFIGNQAQFTMTFDLNKLLVPTPPIRDANGNIIKGENDNRSVVSGIFGSFSDAPGGFNEELKEVYGSAGLEIVLIKALALRVGYFYEDADKGDRQYATAGIGVLLDTFDFNASYIAATQTESPFAGSLRFSIIIHFGKKI